MLLPNYLIVGSGRSLDSLFITGEYSCTIARGWQPVYSSGMSFPQLPHAPIFPVSNRVLSSYYPVWRLSVLPYLIPIIIPIIFRGILPFAGDAGDFLP